MLEQLFSEAQRYDTDLTCIMIDLDEYKKLNDTYGHQIGDQLLIVAAKAIAANLRTMDVAARYGGDEFICLLPHAGAAEAHGVAERIREQFGSASANLLKWERRVTMSIGIGSLREHRPDSFEQLVALADAALYRARRRRQRQHHRRGSAISPPIVSEIPPARLNCRPPTVTKGLNEQLSAAAPTEKPAPTVVTVLAIIGICLARLESIVVIINLASLPRAALMGNPWYGYGQSGSHPFWAAYSIVNFVVGDAVAVLLLASSIACIRLIPWGRRWMIIAAWASIAQIAAVTAVNATHQAELKQRHQYILAHPSHPPRPQQFAAPSVKAGPVASFQHFDVLASHMVGATIFCPLTTLIFPIWIVATFGTPRVRNAFENNSAPPPLAC